MDLMVCKSQLKERGWTDALIKKYLPTPDSTKPNPMYRKASPMLLYSEERVELIESSESFLTDKKKAAKRREKALLVAEEKREAMTDFAKNVKIVIPDVPFQILQQDACDSYNDFHSQFCNDSDASLTSEASFLKRITINYIRHNLTSYDEELYKMFGKVGVQEAHDILQERINKAIAEKYPQLK